MKPLNVNTKLISILVLDIKKSISHNILMEGQACGEIIVYRKEWVLNSGF